MGFRLNLKWGFSLHSPFSSTNSSSSSSSWPSSYSYKGREIFPDAAKISLSSVVCGESETLSNDPLRAQSPLTALETLENNSIDDELQMPTEGDKRFLASLQAAKTSQFGQLMKNLNVLEQRLTDSDAIRLERDILLQIEKLGALELFHKCLSRTLNKPNIVELSDTVTEVTEDMKASGPVDSKNNKLLVPSVRRERRQTRRKRASKKGINNSILESYSKSILIDPAEPKFSSGRKRSKSRVQRWKVAKNEAEMSRGVKLLAELERIRKLLEEESDQVVSLSSWAEAAGVEIKVLQKHLHFGWYCRDQLLRSTRSLVVYLARNYRGLGVAFEDLIQAGN